METQEMLLEKARKILNKKKGTFVTSIHSPVILKDLYRNILLRCQMDSEKYNSIIIKKMKEQFFCGFSDWASLCFLAELKGINRLVPKYLGGSVNDCFFIMEDLETSENLDTLLNNSSYEIVESAVLQLAKQTAKLQGATLGYEEVFQQIRNSLPEAEECGRIVEAKRWYTNMHKAYQWFEIDGLFSLQDFERCISFINDSYENPGRYLCFTHGDMAPSNNLIKGNDLYLIDFEYGGYRHALYDITCWNILCPLPEQLVTKMKVKYREEFSTFLPNPLEEKDFEKEWAIISAWRALAMLSWIPFSTLETDASWVNDWSMREAVLSTICRLHKECIKFDEGIKLGSAAKELEKHLRQRWNIHKDTIPNWSAFWNLQKN